MRPIVAVMTLFTLASLPAVPSHALHVRPPARTITRSDSSISGVLDHLSGDTYFVKYTSTMPDTYRVYYKITDGDKVVQDTTSMVVRAKSSNSNGPYHCSSSAILTTIKKEKI